MIVGILFVSWFLVWGSGPNTTSVFFPPVLKTFGWSRAKLSAGFSVGALSAGLAGPVVGWLLDRVDARKVMTAGVFLTFLSYVGLSRMYSFEQLVLCNLLVGVGLCACTGIPCSLVIANWFQERRGLAMGIALTGASVGGAVMIVVINHVVASGGWRLAYLIIAVPMLVIVVPLILAFVRTRPAEKASRDATDAAPVQLPGLEVRQAFASRSLWLATLLQFLGASIWAGIGQHFIAYLIGIGYTAAFSAHMLSIVFLVTTAGSLLSGPLADRINARRALAATWVLGAISMVALLYATHLGALGLHVILAGLVIGGTGVLTPLLLLEVLGIKNFGYLMGVSAVFGTLGFAAGPIIAGRIYDVTGSYSIALWIFALASIVCVISCLACRPYEQEQQRMAQATAAA
jgi:MFS family permease